MRSKHEIKRSRRIDDDYVMEPVKKTKRLKKREKQEEYVVESILDHRIDTKNNQIEFLVKWEGYPDEEASWENFFFFTQDQPDMVEKYLLEYFDGKGNLVSATFVMLTFHQELNKFLWGRKR